MKSFKEFLSGVFNNTDILLSEESGMERVSGKELQDRMGKRDFNTLLKDKEFLKFKHNDQIFKYSFTTSGMHKVEVYPYNSSVKDDYGKIAIHSRHDYIIYNGKVVHYQKLSRKSNKDTMWK